MNLQSDNTNELANQLNNHEEGNEKTEEKEEFIEVDGEKYQEDPDNPGEVLRDNDDNPLLFEEKQTEEKDKKGEQFQMPDKFKDKSPEEIAKSYKELESLIDKKAQEKAGEIVKGMQKGEGDNGKKKEDEQEFKGAYPMKDGKIDTSQMTPDQFKDYLLEQIDKKAETIAKKTYADSSKVRSEVGSEIKEAQKTHPLLKTSAEYRELAVAILESSASRGKPVKLEDACKKVDGLLGAKKEINEEEEKKLKQAKANVETPGGATAGGTRKSEGDRIRDKMLESSPGGSELGGL